MTESRCARSGVNIYMSDRGIRKSRDPDLQVAAGSDGGTFVVDWRRAWPDSVSRHILDTVLDYLEASPPLVRCGMGWMGALDGG